VEEASLCGQLHRHQLFAASGGLKQASEKQLLPLLLQYSFVR